MTPNGPISVTGQFVDAVQLQTVSRALWEKLAPEEMEITQTHLKMYGEVDFALSRFYEQAVRQVVEETRVKEYDLRRWFEIHLITPFGTRGLVYRGAESSESIPNVVIDRLIEQRIVRAELRAGAVWYELTHDRLIEPIQQSNREWLASHSSGRQRQMENRAQAWLKPDGPQELRVTIRRLRFAITMLAITTLLSRHCSLLHGCVKRKPLKIAVSIAY